MKLPTRLTRFDRVFLPLLITLLSGGTIPPLPLFAEWLPSGTQVTPYNSAIDSHFGLVPDSSGGCYLAYFTSYDPDATGEPRCKVQHINRDGEILWPEEGIFVADPDSMYAFYFGASISAPGGGLYVVFEGKRTEARNNTIWIQRFSPEGERLFGPRGIQLTLNDSTDSNYIQSQWWRATAADGVGGIIVGHYYGTVENGQDIAYMMAHRVTSDGEVVWRNVRVSPDLDAMVGTCRAVTSPFSGVAFFTEIHDSLIVRYVNLNGQVFWEDNPTIIHRDIYDEEHELYYSCNNYNVVSLHGGGYGIGCGSYQQVRYFCLDSDGIVQNGEHGTLLLYGDNRTSPYFELTCQGGNAAIGASDEHVYVFITRYVDEVGFRNLLYKCSCSGDIENPASWEVGQVAFPGATQLFVEPMYQFLTFRTGGSGPLPFIPTAKLVVREGELPWGFDGDTLTHPQRYPADRMQTIKSAPDTFITAWFCHNVRNGEWVSAFLMTQKVVSEEDYPVQEPQGNASPSALSIAHAYPDPFNSSVTVQYDIDSPGRYEFTVFNLLGESVHKDTIQVSQSSRGNWHWRADKYASGVYLIQLRSLATNATVARKVTLVR